MAYSSQNIRRHIHRLPPQGAERSSVPRAVLFFIIGTFLSFASCPHVSYAETNMPREYEVKAALIFTITKFVDWPDSGTGPASPLCIAVLGQDPFGQDLENLQGKSAKGRAITVRRFRRVEDVKKCEVLYISSSERSQLQRIVRHLKNSSVLTVSDQKGFCQAGGMINLVTFKNKVSFEVNNASAQQANLRISSKLLKLARTVLD